MAVDLAGKTALVTGATGFLGGALARRLAADRAKVKALARRPERDRYIKGVDGIEIVSGDITDANRMLDVIQGCDYVFHVAAALGGRLDHQRKINVDGTCNVMRAAGEAKVRRVVHVSSIAVYGYGYLTDVSEDMPQKPGRVPYNVTKSESERVVQEVAGEYGLSYSIIRPGMIYGPCSSGWTVSMFKLARRKPTIWIGDGAGLSHPIYIDDVVDLTQLLSTHPAADGHAFNCAPDPAPSWREFLGAYSKLVGHQRWLGVPVWFARLMAPLLELGLTLRGEPQDLPLLIPFLQSQKAYKMTKARELLGWQPKVSLQEGIASCAPYLRQKGLLE